MAKKLTKQRAHLSSALREVRDARSAAHAGNCARAIDHGAYAFWNLGRAVPVESASADYLRVENKVHEAWGEVTRACGLLK